MSTKKIYVVGDNTSKSLSPKIFNYWFKKYNVDATYDYIEIKKSNFDDEIKTIIEKKDFYGMNITIPYKEKIIPHISETDEDSKEIGAVNCLTNQGGKIIGNNTDWQGIKNSLTWLESSKRTIPIKIKKNTAIVIGYGGAARAAIFALSKAGYRKIKIFNRSFDKIKNISKKHPNTTPHQLEELKNQLKTADLIINTVPVPIITKDHIEEKLNVFFEQQTCGYDLVYNSYSNFLDFFSPQHQIKGTWMLIFQAIPCFKMWFDVLPEVDDALVELIINKKHF